MSSSQKKNITLSQKELKYFQKQFGSKVKETREGLELSQLDIASRLNVEKTSISRIENGRVNFTLSTAAKLAKVLEVELSSLFDFPSKYE
ncbi:helix-turn-helix transcriptional regulator [uncultured Psychroserpens sp.]|uniref:helix-turn-helix transcriptional regulator n=1 Tax=uncultured Psychroserpens sp. TaxID=255436 RepID=UPI002627EDAB|nr:helix-turn-helix transcriptional regulator [uncultured Psychroserpens sp.]